MSSAKRGGGLQPYIDSPLFGGQVPRNPAGARFRTIQQELERSICELAMNRFGYINMPDSVPQRFVELQLMYNGTVVWYWDDDFEKLLAVHGNNTGATNFYGDPISFTTIGPGNVVSIPGADGKAPTFKPKTLAAYIPTAHKDLDSEKKKRKAVGMYPNSLRIPEYQTILLYSQRLAEIDRTLEINSKNARRNKVLSGPANTQLTLTNIARQQDEGVEVIQTSSGMSVGEAVSSIDLGINTGQLTDLSLQRKTWWNECMTLLGIENANQDKKERVNVDEVNSNNAQTNSFQHVALNARRQALEYVNDIWGTNIQVDYMVNIQRDEEAKKEAKLAEQVKNSSATSDKDSE